MADANSYSRKHDVTLTDSPWTETFAYEFVDNLLDF